MEEGSGRITDGLPDEQFCVLIFIAVRDGVVISQEFVNGPDLPVDKMEEGVGPEKDQDGFEEKVIERMFLSDMIELMLEDLLPPKTVGFQLFIPEDTFVKRKGSAGFIGHEEFNIPDTFSGIATGKLIDIA